MAQRGVRPLQEDRRSRGTAGAEFLFQVGEEHRGRFGQLPGRVVVQEKPLQLLEVPTALDMREHPFRVQAPDQVALRSGQRLQQQAVGGIGQGRGEDDFEIGQDLEELWPGGDLGFVRVRPKSSFKMNRCTPSRKTTGSKRCARV